MTGLLGKTRDTWFTADLHLGHARIIELCGRPFRSVAAMNAALIERWNRKVDQDDTVWVLGDVAMGQVDESLALIPELNGTKHLIAGNHDRAFHGYGDHAQRPDKLARWVDAYREAGFASVVTGKATAKHGGVVTLPLRSAYGVPSEVTVGLCHFPTTGESRSTRDDRYGDYRPRHGRNRPSWEWLIHGHVHNGWTVNGKMINVGVDVWDYAPVPAKALIDIMREGMPPCSCSSSPHAMGSPGCVINGGPVDAPSPIG